MAGVVRWDLTLAASDLPVRADIGSVQYDESIHQDIEITTGTTDSQLAFGGVTTVDVLYLISDQAITLNLEATTGTDIPVDANKPIFLSGSSITAAYVSNSSGSTANIHYDAWGT